MDWKKGIVAAGCAVTAALPASAGQYQKEGGVQISRSDTYTYVSAHVKGIVNSSDPYSFAECTSNLRAGTSSCRVRASDRSFYYCSDIASIVPPLTEESKLLFRIRNSDGVCTVATLTYASYWTAAAIQSKG